MSQSQFLIQQENIEYFDDILQNKIRYGRSQFLIISCFFSLYFYDGAEVVVVAFVLPIIKNEWNLHQSQVQLVGSLIFLGWAFGAVLFGFLSDRFGRKQTAKYAILLQIVTGFFSAFSQNYLQFTLLRFLFGMSTGLVCPLISCYTTEIIPKDSRGKMFTIILNMFVLGEITAILLAIALLQNLTQGNWRMMLLLSCIPSLISLYLSNKYLIESPRYQLCCTRASHQEVFDNLDEMGKTNNSSDYICLSMKEKERLVKWAEMQYQEQKLQDKSQIKQLFNKQNYIITLQLMTMWFSLSFIYYGIMYVLPFILIQARHQNTSQSDNSEQQKHNGIDFFGIFLSCFAQIPSNALVYFTIDNPKFGRIKGLRFSYLLCCLVCLLIYFLQSTGLLFFLLVALVKFLVNYCFGIIYPFTAEVYVTSLRSAGTGFNNSICRIGGVIMPWVTFAFFHFGIKGPFLSFFIVSGLSTISAFTIKYDTTNISLDIYGKDEYIK